MLLQDNIAVTLFINFYKLLFLGTEFSRKMLKLQVVEESKEGNKLIITDDGIRTDEEGKMSDN